MNLVLEPVYQSATNIGLVNPCLQTTSTGGTWMSGAGSGDAVSSNWFDPTYSGVNIPDGTTIYELKFKYLGGNTNLVIDTSLSFVYDVNFLEFVITAINGSVGEPVPIVTTLDADDITSTSATLKGIVNANSSYPADVTFEYGISTNYGNTITPPKSPVNGNNDVEVSYQLTGLLQNITYHFRIKAQNPSGTVFGDDKSFTTQPNNIENITSGQFEIITDGNRILLNVKETAGKETFINVYNIMGVNLFSGILKTAGAYEIQPLCQKGLLIIEISNCSSIIRKAVVNY